MADVGGERSRPPARRRRVRRLRSKLPRRAPHERRVENAAEVAVPVAERVAERGLPAIVLRADTRPSPDQPDAEIL